MTMIFSGLGEIAERLRRCTVLLQPNDRGAGSGVLWSADGLIITNAHVASGARARVQLWDGREFQATVSSRDPRLDLAVLRIEADALPVAIAADSSQVRPGELAVAVGNPLGFVGALTTGVIHAVGPLRRFGPRPWIQADLRLAPGNSGGPLADAQGRVIGINTMVAGRLALAIPSNVVTRFVAGETRGPWLGVTVRPVHVPRANQRVFGLVVLEVQPGSPASQASLLTGDILLGTEANGFHSLEDLARALEGNMPGVLRLEFLRGDYARVRRVAVQLGVQPTTRGSVAA
jgi:serine protease Do